MEMCTAGICMGDLEWNDQRIFQEKLSARSVGKG